MVPDLIRPLVRALVLGLGLGLEVAVEAGAEVEVVVAVAAEAPVHPVPHRAPLASRMVPERSLEVLALWCWVLSVSLRLV